MTIKQAREVLQIEDDEEVDISEIVYLGKLLRAQLNDSNMHRAERYRKETKLNACIVLYTGKEM